MVYIWYHGLYIVSKKDLRREAAARPELVLTRHGSLVCADDVVVESCSADRCDPWGGRWPRRPQRRLLALAAERVGHRRRVAAVACAADLRVDAARGAEVSLDRYHVVDVESYIYTVILYIYHDTIYKP